MREVLLWCPVAPPPFFCVCSALRSSRVFGLRFCFPWSACEAKKLVVGYPWVPSYASSSEVWWVLFVGTWKALVWPPCFGVVFRAVFASICATLVCASLCVSSLLDRCEVLFGCSVLCTLAVAASCRVRGAREVTVCACVFGRARATRVGCVFPVLLLVQQVSPCERTTCADVRRCGLCWCVFVVLWFANSCVAPLSFTTLPSSLSLPGYRHGCHALTGAGPLGSDA